MTGSGEPRVAWEGEYEWCSERRRGRVVIDAKGQVHRERWYCDSLGHPQWQPCYDEALYQAAITALAREADELGEMVRDDL